MNKEVYKDIGVIKNKWIETKDDYLDMSLNIISDLQQENKELHNKIDKAIEYLINPPKKIWEGHSIDEVVRILKGDVDE